MQKWILVGRVLPERYGFELPDSVSLAATLAEFGAHVQCVLSIINSQVSCLIEVDADIDLWSLRNALESMVASVVDAAGFIIGRGYEVVLENATDPDTGAHTVFGVGAQVLESTTSDRPVTLDKLLQLSSKSRHLYQALADLRRAVIEPGATGFYAFRAVESLRHHWAFDGDSAIGKREQWEQLATDLNIERSVTDFLRQWATGQRHGEPIGISDGDRGKVLLLAWSVVYRFCLLIDDRAPVRPDDLPPLGA